MSEVNIRQLMETAMGSLLEMMDVNTVVGDLVETSDNVSVIPISRVSCGFVAGGGEYGKQEAAGKRVAVLCAEESKENYCCKHIYSLGSLKSETEISAHLFAALRSFDTEEMEVIYSESFENTKLASAIMNRLRKAAGYQIIQA